MTYITKVRLPEHFYSLTHPKRWQNTFALPTGEERRVLLPQEIRKKAEREIEYKRWLEKRGLKPKAAKFQAIQITGFKHSLSSRADWWDNYQDCLFYVFVEPQTFYDKVTKDWVQYYILAPEDSEMVLRYEQSKKDVTLPPRSSLKEPWISSNKKINGALPVATECCRHWRHETTAGQLPEGL